MISWLLLVLRTLRGLARSRISLAAENAILRHQLAVLQRGRSRPLLRPADRVLWIWLCRHWNWWRQALVLIQPATVLRWHREGYRRHWRRRSGRFIGRPSIPRSHISLIRRISSDHPEWGEDRIALELKARLGVEHAPGTIRRYMVTRMGDGAPASSTWRTFLAGHAAELWNLDLTTQPLWNYSMRYVLVIMELRSRRVVHVAVTASPTLAWVKQQVREATPFGSVPRFLVHDSEDHLRRTVPTYVTYYNGARPHQGIEGIPECGPGLPRVSRPATGDGPIKFVAHPVLGGLHHDYQLVA